MLEAKEETESKTKESIKTSNLFNVYTAYRTGLGSLSGAINKVFSNNFNFRLALSLIVHFKNVWAEACTDSISYTNILINSNLPLGPLNHHINITKVTI